MKQKYFYFAWALNYKLESLFSFFQTKIINLNSFVTLKYRGEKECIETPIRWFYCLSAVGYHDSNNSEDSVEHGDMDDRMHDEEIDDMMDDMDMDDMDNEESHNNNPGHDDDK